MELPLYLRELEPFTAISDAVVASEFQVFTREGRHIAGTALTAETTNL